MELKSGPKLIPFEQRFWRHVQLGDGCWPWMGATNRDGYGTFRNGRKDYTELTHRIAYRLAVGPIADGEQILHCCDGDYPCGDRSYRRCCRPDHLRPGTNSENVADRVAHGRSAFGNRNAAHIYPERILRGENSPCAKISDAEVAEIRALDGLLSATQTAKIFDIGRSQVQRIRAGIQR